MKHLIKLLIATGLFFSSSSFADFLIEPYLGYHTGKFEQGSVSETVKGPAYGLRGGFSQLGFQVGADFMGGTWEVDSSPSVEYKLTNLGVFVGYSFPILVRAYGTYFFDSEMKDDNGKLEGNGIRLGVGFSPLPLLDVNVEYMMSTFDKYSGTSITDVKVKTFGLVLSLPFEL